MTVNGERPDANGDLKIDLSDIDKLKDRVAGLDEAVNAETQRATGAEEALSGRITDEVQARERLATDVQGNAEDIARNATAITGLGASKADKATTYTKEEVDAAVAAATPADYDSVKTRLATVEGKIPSQASAQNQLADKAFVNSSIATNTANYIYKTAAGKHVPFDSLAELQGYTGTLTNNDYAFVVGTDATGNTTYTRYKWNGSTEEWAEEYVLNNSSFTAEQWAAISSGITSGLVAKLGALPTAEALAAALAGKASKADATLTPIYSDTPTFSEWVCQPDIVEVYWDDFRNMWQTGPSESTRYSEEAYNPNATNIVFSLEASGGEVTATRTRTDIIGYTLGDQSDKPLQPKGDYAPATGIAKSALAQDVQTSLSKADTALQTAPVASVNGKTGAVTLTASDVGALGNSGSQTLNGVLTQTGSGPQGIEKGICIGNRPNSGTDWFFSAYGSYPTDITIRIPFSSAAQLVGVDPTFALLSDITAAISPTDSIFSNAVLAVGLGIDTNAVAVINELVDSAHDLPVSGATSVGALLLALSAAVAALKKKLPYEIVSPAVTVANGAETCQLVDRAVNSVTLATSAFAPAFPASPGAGLARDFFVRITAASDVTLTLPAGVTVENAAGDIPAIEGGATTILYFSEVASNRFLLKGETVEAAT